MNRKHKRYGLVEKSNNPDGRGLELFVALLYMIVFFVAGGLSVNYLLMFFAHAAIPFMAAGVIGIVIGPVIVSIAIVVLILHSFGII